MNNLTPLNFIKAYLNFVRHEASQISQEDRGIFPIYWFHPYQIILYKNLSDDIAIVFKRKVSGKVDKISIRNATSRIEEAVLPNLDYRKNPLFKLDNVHDVKISGMTCRIGISPLFTIGLGSEARFSEIRVEASSVNYPREFELLWLFTFPNQHYFNLKKAESSAIDDFWERIGRGINLNVEDFFKVNFGKTTLEIFLKYLEKVRYKLNGLITRQDIVEQDLQNFLEMHYFLLYEGRPLVKKGRDIGGFKTDFTLELNNGIIVLTELQLNYDPLIINDKPSSGLKEAIEQINDWFGWIERSDINNIDRYIGRIIIGRKNDYQKSKVIIDKLISQVKYPLEFRTYDDLNDNLDLLIAMVQSAINRSDEQFKVKKKK